MTEPAAEAGQGSSRAEAIGGRYRLERKIGSGGMASVWLARDERLGRAVAVKRLHTEVPEDAARRLSKEARIGAALNHPNLVTVYDAVPEGEGVLIVMEYVDGPDLDRLLADGPPPEERTLEILASVGSALDHLHASGVVHRDIKPSNVLVDRGGEVKLTDLGIARALADTDMTQSGVMLGSLPYMSPEQLGKDDVGAPSDIYQLALIAYELLSGQRARPSGEAPQVAYAALNREIPDLRDVRPGTPPAAADALRRGLDRDPSARPRSACELVEELTRALTAPPASAEPVFAPPSSSRPLSSAAPGSSRRPRHTWAALAGLVAVALATLAIVLLIDGGQGSEEGVAGGQPSSAPPAEDQGGSAAEALTAEDPSAAVESFYSSAAAGDIDAAWELATPALREQLGGRDDYAAQQSTLESIEFTSLETASESADTASVDFETVATHTDRVDRCSGSATMVSAAGGWMLDSLEAIDCA